MVRALRGIVVSVIEGVSNSLVSIDIAPVATHLVACSWVGYLEKVEDTADLLR